MNTTTNSLVQKLWNYCNVLRDDGMRYGDYVEQLTYMLFLKMADERSAPPYNQASIVPAAYARPTLFLIFGKAQNKFQDPAKLRRVIVDLIDAETGTILGADVKGRRLRRLAGEKRARHQKRRGPVLHAPCAHPGHGGLHGSAARRACNRPGLWHRWLLVHRLRAGARHGPRVP